MATLITYDQFIKNHVGKAIDYDNVAGVQCVDLVKCYLKEVFGISAAAWGDAHCYYDNFNNISALKNNFQRIANTPSFVPQKGDIAVWGANLSAGGWGHIAVCTGEGTTTYFYSYDQNWTGKHDACTKIKHNYIAFLGVLRPKQQEKINGEKSTSYTNSSLVNYTRYSPNCNKPRNNKIDTITIHHMADVMTVEQCGAVFAPTSREASSNYGIDSNGRVGLYVDEANRSWCTSSAANDNRAITIEVSNSQTGGNWPVSDKALSKLIELCTDICRRNGIKALNYTGDKSGNMTLHKWFAATACPGPYLESKMPYIAAEVNKRLGSSNATTDTMPSNTFKAYKVRVTCKSGLNVRKDAGVNNAKVSGVSANYNVIYTITAEKTVGSQVWGKLKSGAGWICLTGYTVKV